MRFIFAVCMAVVLSAAQVLYVHALTATTDEGKKVILNSDGTWKYAPLEPRSTSESGVEWKKPASAKSVLKGKAGFYELWYDPAKWTPSSSPNNPAVEYTLTGSLSERQVTVISERTPMPLDTLKNAAIENAKHVAPDLKIDDEQKIMVNGTNVLKMKMRGTIEGIPFAYYCLYWAGKSGALQVIAYTSQNLAAEFRPEFEKLLSGLVITAP